MTRPEWIAIAALVAVAISCGGNTAATGTRRPGARAAAPAPAKPLGKTSRGKATFYGKRFHGRKTASGERYNRHKLTAAHRKLAFGTRVRVTNLSNGRAVVVRINDRGPFGGKGRIIDVSEAAANKLGMIRAGVVPVKVEVLSVPKRKRKPVKRTKR